MKKLFTLLVGCLSLSPLMAQINMEDSTVQTIAYWDKGQKQNYHINVSKIKLDGKDTTSKNSISYDVEVTVLDSTEKTYTIQWVYKNYTTSFKDPLLSKILTANNNQKVIYKTDENGMIQEVVNWQELSNNAKKTMNEIGKDSRITPEIKIALDQAIAISASKESIESNGIKDIQQFHNFHGAKYKLGEVLEGKLEVNNMFGGKPFDCNLTVLLDEIYGEELNYLIRSSEVIDQQQLIDATYGYMTQLAKNLNTKAPDKKLLKDLKNETNTSNIIHNDGWVVYSYQVKEVNADKSTQLEIREIEIQ